MFLLDTCVLLWWLGGESMSADATQTIKSPDNLIFVSVVSLWEIRIKQGLGKLEVPKNFLEVVEEQSFRLLDLKAYHTESLVDLPHHHRDPFDRMLIAQGISDELAVVTRDSIFDRYEVCILAA